ncbi:sugar-binding transcriptional regulator [Acidisoma sp. C75]
MTEEAESRASRLPAQANRDHLMVKVARMAYQQDCTLIEIANETGLNRWQVSRLLQEARDLGIVRIEIVPRTQRHPELETALTRTFGLRDAVVVPGAPDPPEPIEAVAQAAGYYLASIKPRPTVLGVSWGRTMGAVAHWLPPRWADGVVVVQINGTVAPIPGAAHHNDVAEAFARKGNGKMIPLPVPAIVGAKLTREVLEKDRIVSDVMRSARAAPLLVFSMGVAGEESVLLKSGNILPDEMTRLTRAGAVGDVLGRFINSRGEIVDQELDARTIGLAFADLRQRERVIGIAAGLPKHGVVLGALRAGLINTIITDEATARYAMEHSHDR